MLPIETIYVKCRKGLECDVGWECGVACVLLRGFTVVCRWYDVYDRGGGISCCLTNFTVNCYNVESIPSIRDGRAMVISMVY